MLTSIIVIALFLAMAVFLISLVVNLFNDADKSIKNGYEDARAKGKLYSQLKIHLINKELDQKEETYHLKGVVDGISYNIQVSKSEYENKKRYYEHVNNDSEHQN
ncbi:hypothetical protein [Providencia sp. 2024EL-00732]|uniref:hypothetical protein n=1 Tax=Providencia sp. 2024EL-00732 TaxID=3374242 RepID=UPI003756B1FB